MAKQHINQHNLCVLCIFKPGVQYVSFCLLIPLFFVSWTLVQFGPDREHLFWLEQLYTKPDTEDPGLSGILHFNLTL